MSLTRKRTESYVGLSHPTGTVDNPFVVESDDDKWVVVSGLVVGGHYLRSTRSLCDTLASDMNALVRKRRAQGWVGPHASVDAPDRIVA